MTASDVAAQFVDQVGEGLRIGDVEIARARQINGRDVDDASGTVGHDVDGIGEEDSFARGLAAFPDDQALLYSRALMWERRDQIAKAEADFRRILVITPDDVANDVTAQRSILSATASPTSAPSIATG